MRQTSKAKEPISNNCNCRHLIRTPSSLAATSAKSTKKSRERNVCEANVCNAKRKQVLLTDQMLEEVSVVVQSKQTKVNNEF